MLNTKHETQLFPIDGEVILERASGGLRGFCKSPLRIPKTMKRDLCGMREDTKSHRGHHHGAPAPLVYRGYSQVFNGKFV